MEFVRTVRQRRMVRAFTDAAVDPDVVRALCDLARRAPSAGNTQGTAFLVLDDPGAVDRYWAETLAPERRDGFAWPGLLRAPVLVVVAVSPGAYTDRYEEGDKVATGLGAGADAWPVPYWWVDAGAAIEHLLLGAIDVGLGACLFGLFDHEPAVAATFDVPDEWRLVATIALGHPDPDGSDPGRSSSRPRRPLAEVIHRNRW